MILDFGLQAVALVNRGGAKSAENAKWVSQASSTDVLGGDSGTQSRCRFGVEAGMTGRRHVLRKVGKWAGLGVCLFLLAATATYRHWGVRRWEAVLGRLWFSVAWGDLVISWRNSDDRARTSRGTPVVQPASAENSESRVKVTPDDEASVDVIVCSIDTRQLWAIDEFIDLLEAPHRWPEASWGSGGGRVIVPSWLLLPPALVATAFLWWRDRRRIPPGHCRRCGYDLTGNVSGVCPECGTQIETYSTRRGT